MNVTSLIAAGFWWHENYSVHYEITHKKQIFIQVQNYHKIHERANIPFIKRQSFFSFFFRFCWCGHNEPPPKKSLHHLYSENVNTSTPPKKKKLPFVKESLLCECSAWNERKSEKKNRLINKSPAGIHFFQSTGEKKKPQIQIYDHCCYLRWFN